MYVRVFQDDIKVCISRLGKADLPSLVWMGLTHSVESLKNKMSKWEVLLPDWTQNSFFPALPGSQDSQYSDWNLDHWLS